MELISSISHNSTPYQRTPVMSLKELKFRLEDRRIQMNPDEKVVNLRDFQISYDKETMVIEHKKNGDSFIVHPAAERSIYETVRTRKEFRDSCPEYFPFAINESIQTHDWFEKERVLRIVTDLKGNRMVRAIVSEKYGYLDDADWVAPAIEALSEDWGADLVNVGDENTHIRLTNRNTEPLVKGEIAKRAYDFRNSEIAQGGLKISFLYYIVRCTNGMMSASTQDVISTRHIGGRKIESFKGSMNSLMEASSAGWADIKNLANCANMLVLSDPEEAIQKSIKAFALKKHMLLPLLNEIEANPMEGTLYSLSQAYSKVAQAYEMNDRILLEKTGGKILAHPYAKLILPKKEAEALKSLVLV